MEQYYTKEQVSEILGIAQSTVYVLAKKKLIEVEALPQGVSRTKRYTQQSVDAYAERLKIEHKGLTVATFAKNHNLSPQRVYQVIKKHALQLEKVRLGKRKSLLLSPEQQQLLLKDLLHKKHKGTKTDFYRFADDLALFQLFQDKEQMPYRVIRNEAGEWGVRLPVIHTFLPYAQAVTELQLHPVYTIHQPMITSSVYAKFSFHVGDARTYETIDFFYQTVGVENMHLYLLDTTIEVAIKAVTFDVRASKVDQEYLNKNCSNAVVALSDKELRVQTKDKSVTVLLEADVYEAVKHQLTAQKMSFAELINEALREKYV